MQARLSLILPLSAALIGGAALLWWSADSAPPSPANPTSAAAPQKEAQSLPQITGATLAEPSSLASIKKALKGPPPPTLNGRYQLRYEVQMSAVDKAGDETLLTLALTGELNVVPKSQKETDGTEKRWLQASLTRANLQMDPAFQKATDFPKENAAAAFRMPFIIALSPTGQVQDVRFEKGQSIAVRGIYAALAQAAQFTRTDPKAEYYTSKEWSINGPYTARYTRQTAQKYSREWNFSRELELPNPTETPKESLQEAVGGAQLVLKKHYIEKVSQTQAGSASIGASGQRPRYTTSVELVRISNATKMAQLSPSTLEPFVPALLDVHLEKGKVKPFDTSLAAIKSAGDDWQSRIRARKELTRNLIEFPKNALLAKKLFLESAQLENVKRSLVEALVGASTPDAQGVLVDVIEDESVPTPDRTMVLAGMVAIWQPYDATLSGLAELAYGTKNRGEQNEQDRIYQSQVAMVLGAAIANAADTKPEVAKAYLGPYLRQAELALSPPAANETPRFEERGNWLGGLGNVRSPNAYPLIAQNLDASAEEIRTSAAHALRFQDPTTAREKMQQLFQQDPSNQVRMALLHAARYMGPEQMKSFVQKALHYDGSENVRLEAAYTVASWGIDAPGMRTLLAYALERESSAKVRNSLRNYLEKGRIAPPARQVPMVNSLIPEGTP